MNAELSDDEYRVIVDELAFEPIRMRTWQGRPASH